MALKKQFDFSVHGKGVLTDPEGQYDQANMTFHADVIVINGVSYALSTLDGTARTALENAMETIVATLKAIPADIV